MSTIIFVAPPIRTISCILWSFSSRYNKIYVLKSSVHTKIYSLPFKILKFMTFFRLGDRGKNCNCHFFLTNPKRWFFIQNENLTCPSHNIILQHYISHNKVHHSHSFSKQQWSHSNQDLLSHFFVRLPSLLLFLLRIVMINIWEDKIMEKKITIFSLHAFFRYASS